MTSITFKLRANIPWHDNFGDWGTMDAEDVAFTFNSAFDPESVNNGAEEIGPELKLGFDIVDPMTVKMNIEPGGFDPTWVWLLGNAGFNGIVIVNKDAFDQLGEAEFAKSPIGTGKYKALEWVGDVDGEAADPLAPDDACLAVLEVAQALVVGAAAEQVA